MKRVIYGLVLVGGKSLRMGKDKALISYNNSHTQLESTTSLLKSVCEKVFVSQRKVQNFDTPDNTTCIYDSVKEVNGPLCGILSAMRSQPEAHWLIIACDLPNLETNVLRKLISEFEAELPELTAYRSSQDGLPEPLCAIYPAGIADEILNLSQELGSSCPRKILIAMKAKLVEQDNLESLNNINTSEEYRDTIKSKQYT